MLSRLAAVEYAQPTPVQVGVIPEAMRGVDVIGQARTGTGKTAAFAIPILEKLADLGEVPGPQAIILVPTRELAVQVLGEFAKLSKGSNLRGLATYGGQRLQTQINALKKGVNIVVATPGRAIDHLQRGTLNLHRLQVVVLDEADRMLDIGFRPDIEKILKKSPEDRQTLLLSATLPPPILRMAERYMREPVRLDFSESSLGVSTIEQFYFVIQQERKFALLTALLERENPAQAIVFCRTKRRTDDIFRKLSKQFSSVGCIHGDMMQNARNRVMKDFREGNIRFLVATDVVGRGIDVTRISHIINYDIPDDCDDYVHRVGRTGRMGREGVAYTFTTQEDGDALTRIEMRIDRLLKADTMPGFEAPPRPAPVEVTRPRGTPGGPSDSVRDTSNPRPESPEAPATLSSPEAAKPTGGFKKRYRRAL
jgi:ATP-dependent RNA helicase DeaD